MNAIKPKVILRVRWWEWLVYPLRLLKIKSDMQKVIDYQWNNRGEQMIKQAVSEVIKGTSWKNKD